MKLIMALAAFVQARRHLHGEDDNSGVPTLREPLISNDHNQAAAIGTQESPLVLASGSDEMCIFKDALGNEWCFEFRSPMFSIGWEWDVDASNGESVMYQLKPYFEPSFYFKTHFIIARIW